MANTFKVVTFAAEPNSAGTPYTIYTAAGSTTTIVLGLVSTTSSRGGSNNVANGTSFLAQDVPIPVGSSLELLAGNKVVLEAGDVLRVDCSVADKLSGTLSIMEIT